MALPELFILLNARRRDRFLANLPQSSQVAFMAFQIKYSSVSMLSGMISDPDKQIFSRSVIKIPTRIEDFKDRIQEVVVDEFVYKASHYRSLLCEMVDHVTQITLEFHTIFGTNIFDDA